ncbi:hypothetical protein [Cutibacterium sp.]|uniref:hypothetical protein n=1 Tax=Cutibacterium sp. TaxID=1912221 RepID=UPI0026DBDA25|nr:hypothetical protein [Cutibacterium sp.]MDO4413017.1 hypothetical protein [Cutibacterium sp.]
MVTKHGLEYLLLVMVGLSLVACSPDSDRRNEAPRSVASSAEARAFCEDSARLSEAEDLTTSNIGQLKGKKVWVCPGASSDDAWEVMEQGPMSDSDIASMRDAYTLSDVPIPEGADCHVVDGNVYIFTEDGLGFRHRIVECADNAGS